MEKGIFLSGYGWDEGKPCDYYQFGNKMESEMKDYERLKKNGIPMPEMIEADIEKERSI